MNQAQTLQKAFNDHFDEFMEDIVNIFPDDMDIRNSRNSIKMLRKANPKLLIQIWNKYVSSKYASQIEAGDITFFIENDYNDDVGNMENAAQIMSAVDRLRGPIKMMSSDSQEKSMKYIQNLKKIGDMYFSMTS
tara:strand:+ start:214 stop:615 length:402 start_codon:yes stop_codon:yes gene_type:complete